MICLYILAYDMYISYDMFILAYGLNILADYICLLAYGMCN